MTAVPCVASEPKVSTVSSDATDASSAAAGAGAAAAVAFLARRPRRPLRSGDRGSSTTGAPADAVAVVGSVTTEAEAEAKVPTSKSTDATDACDTASSSVFFGRSFRASAAAPRQMAAGSTQ